MYDTDADAKGISKELADRLPTPSGYKLLIALAEIKMKTDGGVDLPEMYAEKERAASLLGFVLKAGPDAYANEKKFPSGPWCQEGDWVILNPYAGVRVTVFGKEFRLVNDDVIEATVSDPVGIGRPGGVGSIKSSIIKPTGAEAVVATAGGTK